MSKPLEYAPDVLAADLAADHDLLRAAALQHRLDQFDPGMVWLDDQRRIVALNDAALHLLTPAAEGVPAALIGANILQVHPQKYREKIAYLLHLHEANAPPPPPAMMITVPDHLLMVKISRMLGPDGPAGTCMIFYDLTNTAGPSREPDEARLLSRVPVYRRDRIVLVDVKDIGRFDGEGHYTRLVTLHNHYLCNLSMAVLEARLDPSQFLRVHRSHIINLNYALELIRADDGLLVVMPTGMGEPVPVSKHKLGTLKSRFGLL
jgi:hypothetical protein